MAWRRGWFRATDGSLGQPWAEFENRDLVLLIARRPRRRLPHQKRWALYSAYGRQVCEGQSLKQLVTNYVTAIFDR